MRDTSDRAELIARLRGEIAACESFGNVPETSAIPTGWPGLDRALPQGGIRCGSLVELLDERAGCGAETVAAVLTRAVCRSPGVVVIVDCDRQFHPLALAAWGVALKRLVVVHVTDDAGALWVADQALRSRAAVAVWLRRDRLAAHDSRRLQLAAEDGGALGILFRPPRARGRPTWADVQMTVEPRPSTRGRRLRLEITRSRGRVAGPAVDIEIDDVRGTAYEGGRHETPALSATAELVGAAAAG